MQFWKTCPRDLRLILIKGPEFALHAIVAAILMTLEPTDIYQPFQGVERALRGGIGAASLFYGVTGYPLVSIAVSYIGFVLRAPKSLLCGFAGAVYAIWAYLVLIGFFHTFREVTFLWWAAACCGLLATVVVHAALLPNAAEC